MLGYTELEIGGNRVLTKNVKVKIGQTEIPLNISLVFGSVDLCNLNQSRASIFPGILFRSKTRGLQKSLEDSIIKCTRSFVLDAKIADNIDQGAIGVVNQLLQITQIMPEENISALTVPVVLTKQIEYTDKLGHQFDMDSAILIPTKKLSVLFIKHEFLEDWLKGLEEAIQMKCLRI